jgi:hypothetical protein
MSNYKFAANPTAFSATRPIIIIIIIIIIISCYRFSFFPGTSGLQTSAIGKIVHYYYYYYYYRIFFFAILFCFLPLSSFLSFSFIFLFITCSLPLSYAFLFTFLPYLSFSYYVFILSLFLIAFSS